MYLLSTTHQLIRLLTCANAEQRLISYDTEKNTAAGTLRDGLHGGPRLARLVGAKARLGADVILARAEQE